MPRSSFLVERSNASVRTGLRPVLERGKMASAVKYGIVIVS